MITVRIFKRHELKYLGCYGWPGGGLGLMSQVIFVKILAALLCPVLGKRVLGARYHFHVRFL